MSKPILGFTGRERKNIRARIKLAMNKYYSYWLPRAVRPEAGNFKQPTTMTTEEAQTKLLNKPATYRIGGMTFDVTIVDHRHLFGREDVRIKPASGSGEHWVNLDSVNLKKT